MKVVQFFKGLHAPTDSLDYKVSMIQAQRLMAPVSSMVLIVLVLLTLTYFLKINVRHDRNASSIEMIGEEEIVELVNLEPPPEAEKTIETDVDVMADVQVDVISPNPIGEVVENQPVTLNPPVALSPSPVVLKGISSRGSGGGGLGSGTRVAGDLVGTLYDFKRTADGKPRRVDYWNDLKAIINAKMNRKNAVPNIFHVTKEVYLSHLLVEKMAAEKGPEVFGVAKLMEAKQWIAHYQGRVQPEASGRYRLVGHFDDALVVLINGKVVLDSGWDYIGKQSPVTGWTPRIHVGKYPSFSGQTLTYSDWIELDADKSLPLDIYVGERPGGLIGGVLMVQQEGTTYEKESNGREILPLFCTSHLSYAERDRMRRFPGMRFSMKIPLMNTRGKEKPSLIGKNEIQVDSGNL